MKITKKQKTEFDNLLSRPSDDVLACRTIALGFLLGLILASVIWAVL